MDQITTDRNLQIESVPDSWSGSSGVAELAGGGGDRQPRPRRLRGLLWSAGAFILLVGIAASVALALLWRADVHGQDRADLKLTASDVSTSLATGLKRDVDLLVTMRALATMQPTITNAQFERWYAQLRGAERQTGQYGSAIIDRVTAAALPSFAARIKADPALGRITGGAYHVIPPVRRPSYCLIRAWASGTSPVPPVPVGLDFCAASVPGLGRSPALSAMRAEASSGDITIVAGLPGGSAYASFVIGAAVYRTDVPLTSAAQRRAALRGWVSSSFDVRSLIRAAVGPHRGLAVELYHEDRDGRRELVGRYGQLSGGQLLTHTVTVEQSGRWIVAVRGRLAHVGSANMQAVALFAGGTLLSVLVFLVFGLVARSREQALHVVHRRTSQLHHQALHDPLTDLPNRTLGLDRAAQMLTRTRHDGSPAAALYVDLDAFKHVNDSFGHRIGDELLKVVAERLRAVVRQTDTVARLGGDEFLVLTGSSGEIGPELVAERVLEVLRQPIELEPMLSMPLSITASIGIAIGPRDSAEELLRDADVALYEAKSRGKDRFTLFESRMQDAAQDRLVLEMDLRHALQDGQLFLLYQPTFDLRTRTIHGVEALLRWRHPTRGVLPPDTFIPIAEQTGLIVPIGRWVLECACSQAAAWMQAGLSIPIAVNVSPRQFERRELLEEIEHALTRVGLDGAMLTIEITETALMRDADTAATLLEDIKALGVHVAVDDFGTGYSSLAHLRRFPVDALKIDRSFVSAIPTAGGSGALIQTFVQLGKTLNLEVIAEGIENHVQLDELCKTHCDFGQGFLFARPLEPDQVQRLATERHAV